MVHINEVTLYWIQLVLRPGMPSWYANVLKKSLRPTQPPILSGMDNEYWPTVLSNVDKKATTTGLVSHKPCTTFYGILNYDLNGRQEPIY